MNKERYNQIIDEAYENYEMSIQNQRDLQRKEVQRLRSQRKWVRFSHIELLSKEEFIRKCKTDSDFSKKWGLIIKETYKLIPHTEVYSDFIVTRPVREYKLIVVYKNEIIEVYE